VKHVKPSIDRIFLQAVEAERLVGAVCRVGTANDTLYEGAIGWRNREAAVAMTPDTVFMLASMTKAVTAVAAMQLVERGRLQLDQPLGSVLPKLAKLMVLEGFTADGQPRLRPPKREITLRHLLTHTSGIGHEIWNEELLRYQSATGTPGLGSRTNASLNVPLLFDPGERWQYSMGLEWTGKVIEAVTGVTLGQYLRENIFEPLDMHDTAFGIVPRHGDRVASVYQRGTDAKLRPIEMAIMPGEYEAGGGGLYGSGADYFAFLRMVLNDGRHGKTSILQPETIEHAHQNHLADLLVTKLVTAQPTLSADFELYPGMRKGWGLTAMITRDKGPDGRSAGSLTWGGLANCFFWIDPTEKLAGVFLTQILPFGDRDALTILSEVEREIYQGLHSASPG
jgi:methyl acetate hydrolase